MLYHYHSLAMPRHSNMLIGLRPGLWAYCVAVLAVTIAQLIQLLLNFWLNIENPFLVFFPAIIISTWYGGKYSGFLAVSLATLLSGYIFIPPAFSLISNDSGENLQLVLFLFEGVFITWLITCFDNAKRQQKVLARKLQTTEDQSRRHEELLNLIANSLPVCISYVDNQQRYKFTNKTYEVWFGFRPEDACNKHIAEVLGEAAYQVVKANLERVLAGNLVEYEATMPYQQGGMRDIRAILVPDVALDGDVRGYCALVIDISERKQAEADIRQLNESLEKRVQERTAKLFEVNQELEAFCYSVSHDLRAPLRGVLGLTQALQEDYGSELDELAIEYTRRIVTAATRMDTLILDLLAYSRLGRKELHLQSLSLTAIIAEVLNELNTELQKVQAQVTLRTPMPFVQGHHSVLIQVVINLVTNAIKFVAAGVQPQVRIWAEKRGKYIRLWVEDNGIGIAPQHQKRIFRAFERLHGVESYPGTGIGLAIVKRSVERMGGTVGVESEVGKGSRFWIELLQSDGNRE